MNLNHVISFCQTRKGINSSAADSGSREYPGGSLELLLKGSKHEIKVSADIDSLKYKYLFTQPMTKI